MSAPKILPAWFYPLARYRFGLGPRPANAPKPTAKWTLEEFAKFEAWNAWKDRGGKRPAVWRLVPVWAWKLRAELKRSLVPVLPPKPAPAPVVIDTVLVARARNIVFCADNPLAALRAPAHYKVAVTADPGLTANPTYRSVTLEAIPRLKDQGRNVFAWCDCRPWGSGTPASEAIKLAHDHGLAGWIGQGERQDELDHALDAGASIIIGNPNSWTELGRVRAKVAAGELAIIAEVYTNVAGNWPKDYGVPQGLSPASLSLGMYDAASEGGGYRPLADYRANTPAAAWPHIGVYHAGGMRDEDWRILP